MSFITDISDISHNTKKLLKDSDDILAGMDKGNVAVIAEIHQCCDQCSSKLDSVLGVLNQIQANTATALAIEQELLIVVKKLVDTLVPTIVGIEVVPGETTTH